MHHHDCAGRATVTDNGDGCIAVFVRYSRYNCPHQFKALLSSTACLTSASICGDDIDRAAVATGTDDDVYTVAEVSNPDSNDSRGIITSDKSAALISFVALLMPVAMCDHDVNNRAAGATDTDDDDEDICTVVDVTNPD
jgi:hypothetical protein